MYQIATPPLAGSGWAVPPNASVSTDISLS